jgi:hypothetical protein
MQNVEICPRQGPRSTICTYAVQNVELSPESGTISTFCTRG